MENAERGRNQRTASPAFPGRGDENASAGARRVVKDGGDDPDCTHGAVLEARVSAAVPEQAAREDYLLPISRALLILRSGGGIGLCTLPGLDCEQHKWAINQGPRRMIADNLARSGMREGCWLAEISVRDGEKLAGKTLNPLLGVVGGTYSAAVYTESTILAIRF